MWKVVFLLFVGVKAQDLRDRGGPPMQKPSAELKSMLLENLNKHAPSLEGLEPLGNARTRLTVKDEIVKNEVTNQLQSSLHENEVDLPFSVVPSDNFFDQVSNSVKAHDVENTVASNTNPLIPLSGFGDPFGGQGMVTLPSTQTLVTFPTLPPFTMPTMPPFTGMTLPPLLALPSLNLAHQISQNRQNQQTSTFPTLQTYPTTLPPPATTVNVTVIKELRNRMYKTLKRINVDLKANNHEKVFYDLNQLPEKVNLEKRTKSKLKTNVQKPIFSVEKSGYNFTKIQGTPQQPSGRTELKEYSFAGDRYRKFTLLKPLPRPGLKPSGHLEKHLSEKVHVNNDREELEGPCPAVGCNAKSHNPWLFQNDVVLDNTDTCNNPRLKALVQNLIIGSDAEASKTIIQQKTEEVFEKFYNVICGTGFFSYIAHTDEFCLVTVGDVNCYVFSPVCTDSLGFGSGILKRQLRRSPQNKNWLNNNKVNL